MSIRNTDSDNFERYIYTFIDLTAYVDRVTTQAAQAGLSGDVDTMDNLIAGLVTQLITEQHRVMAFIGERYTDETWTRLQQAAKQCAKDKLSIAADAVALSEHKEIA